MNVRKPTGNKFNSIVCCCCLWRSRNLMTILWNNNHESWWSPRLLFSHILDIHRPSEQHQWDIILTLAITCIRYIHVVARVPGWVDGIENHWVRAVEKGQMTRNGPKMQRTSHSRSEIPVGDRVSRQDIGSPWRPRSSSIMVVINKVAYNSSFFLEMSQWGG